MPIDLSTIPGPLVSTEWLAGNLDHPQVRVVDMRGLVLPPTEPRPWYFGRHADYLAGHIPGAVYIDWTKDIIDPNDPVPAQVAPPEQYAEVLGRAGIDNHTLVVAYDDHFGMFAGRLWWTLRYYGHEAVRVLDGGLKRWLAEGRPLEMGETVVAPTTFIPRPRPELRRTVEEISSKLGTCMLVDARKHEEFVGEQSRAVRGGHLPGAQNVFYQRLAAGPDETFLPPEQVAAILREAGINTESGEIVAYCNGGVSATTVLLGLAIVGRDDAALYDGSWNEWGNRADLPIEQ